MGVEQYIYEMLGRPDCQIMAPVANEIISFPSVDWIRPIDWSEAPAGAASDEKLLLLGGCDLLQVATYCSTNRAEYVNSAIAGHRIRHDDPGFILSPRTSVARSSALRSVPCWSAESTVEFDEDVRTASVLVISLWEALLGDFLLLDGDILIRLAPRLLGAKDTLATPSEAAPTGAQILRFTLEQKLDLVARSLGRLTALSERARLRFLLGTNTRLVTAELDARIEYNRFAEAYCQKNREFEFVPVDEIVPVSEVIDGMHFTRLGYHRIAERLGDRIR